MDNDVSKWQLSMPDFCLPKKTVHVWRIHYQQLSADLKTVEKTLSTDELNRANRFHFEKDRSHFIIFRGALRILTGRYLNCEPHQLRFQYGKHGKPYITHKYQGASLYFNMAHSNHLAVIGFTRTDELGIDIEFIRPVFAFEDMGERIFSFRESKEFRALPNNLKQKAFFNCWTRKEAFIKAIGKGLSFPLDQFSVSFVPGQPCRLIDINGDPEKTKRWSLFNIEPYQNYVAALAIARCGLQMDYYTLTQAVFNTIHRN